jgi:hypothetical protein
MCKMVGSVWADMLAASERVTNLTLCAGCAWQSSICKKDSSIGGNQHNTSLNSLLITLQQLTCTYPTSRGPRYSGKELCVANATLRYYCTSMITSYTTSYRWILSASVLRSATIKIRQKKANGPLGTGKCMRFASAMARVPRPLPAPNYYTLYSPRHIEVCIGLCTYDSDWPIVWRLIVQEEDYR